MSMAMGDQNVDKLKSIDFKALWSSHDIQNVQTARDGDNFVCTITAGPDNYVGRGPDYLIAHYEAWHAIPQLAGFNNDLPTARSGT